MAYWVGIHCFANKGLLYVQDEGSDAPAPESEPIGKIMRWTTRRIGWARPGAREGSPSALRRRCG